MARIAGVDLPRHKRDRHRAPVHLRHRQGAREARSARPPSVPPDEAAPTSSTRTTSSRSASVIERATRSKAICAARSQMNIKRLMDLGCYRGLRHRKGLPVRGQRTHTNARTRKGPRKGARRSQDSRRTATKERKPWRQRAPDGGAEAGGKAKAQEEGQEERLDAASRTSSRRSTTRSSRSPTCNGQRRRVVERRRRAASRARARARRSRRSSRPKRPARKAMEHGMRSVAVFVKGPGAGRESALRALAGRRLQGHAHP